MAASAFSKFAFQRALKAGDSSRFGIDLKKDKLAEIAKAKLCSRDPKEISNFNQVTANGKLCISYSDYSINLVLRALANNINYRSRISMPDRDQIVLGVKQALADATPMAIHRRDIRSFYESIPLDGLRKDYLATALLSPRARNVLQEYFKIHCNGTDFGVPRGLSVSASLAEAAMMPFDDAVRSHPGVYRYFRFSDDILIFSHDVTLDVDNLLAEIFPPSFSINKEKRTSIVVNGADQARYPFKTFEYLGYAFYIHNGAMVKNSPRQFSVCIADSKIKKLKSRVILTAKRFVSENNADILLDRLYFLSGNYRVSRGRINVRAPKRKVRSGIYFNYRHCCDAPGELDLPRNADRLKALDGFMHSLLWSKNSEFESTMRLRLSIGQKAKLRRLSFFHGFDTPLMRSFKPHRIREIKRAWTYVR